MINEFMAKLHQDLTRLEEAVEQLRTAVEDEGPNPHYHRSIKALTERNWPSLMEAVYAVLKASK